MKKIILSLFFILVFSVILSPVLAHEDENEGSRSGGVLSNIKAKVQTILERRSNDDSSKAANLDSKKAENIARVRNSLKARWDAYDKLVVRSGLLLDKLQIRIDKAKAAGKDTKDMDKQMTDARAKLADARTKLDGLKSLIGTNLDKNGFKDAQKTLQAVHKDLNAVRLDAAKIIKNLRSFNSEKSATESAEIHASSSAKDK